MNQRSLGLWVMMAGRMTLLLCACALIWLWGVRCGIGCIDEPLSISTVTRQTLAVTAKLVKADIVKMFHRTLLATAVALLVTVVGLFLKRRASQSTAHQGAAHG